VPGTDDRDRAGAQHRPQAGDLGRGSAFEHRLGEAVALDGGTDGRDGDRHVPYVERRLAADRQAEVVQHVGHVVVDREHLGRQAGDPGRARGRHQLLQQQGPDPAVLVVMGDRDGDLVLVRPWNGAVVRQADQPVALERSDRGPGRTDDAVGEVVQVRGRDAEEP
jgi:hypothetical protein